MRRWLNRSLYSPGIASGLNVYAIKDQPRVRVTPGLAIDHLGREIILLDEQIVDVVGGHMRSQRRVRRTVSDHPLSGRRRRPAGCVCAVGGSALNRAAWGGPARILAGAALEFNARTCRTRSSGKIPLACLRLSKGCKSVDAVDKGVRRYIGESSAEQSAQYALEGERHIDPKSPGRIQFHIRGRQPTSVILYLRAERFSTLFYSELGSHTHGTNSNGYSVTVPAHHHTLPQIDGHAGTGLGGGDVPELQRYQSLDDGGH